MNKNYYIEQKEGVNKLELNGNLQNATSIKKSVHSFIDSKISVDLVVLIAALWSGPDRLMIERGIDVLGGLNNVEFGIKGFDKKEELETLLAEENLPSIMTPYWLFVRGGKILHRESGKIYSAEELRSQVENLDLGIKPTAS